MAATCPVCGEKVGGLTGMPKPNTELKEQGLAAGVYLEGMCGTCLSRALRGAPPKKAEDKMYEEMQTINSVLQRMFISPSRVPDTAQDMGLVTGYCILGTGPFTALFSAVTDTFGIKSNAYLEKARAAEREALNTLKIEALKKGADAIYCLRLSLTEATAGNGMLMVTVTGAATKTGKDDPIIQKAIEYLNQ